MGWGLFKSKKKTYVSSSSFPMFDPDKRVDNFEAAMIDHTSTLAVEQSEYLRTHYANSKLKNIWGLLRWAENSGFNNSLGKITATFYADPKINNSEVADAIRPYLNLGDVDEYGVYSVNLSFFSEDFYIRHLATQQGKAHWFVENTEVDYTISYPSAGVISAYFPGKGTISGTLPSYAGNTRFLEICYSTIKKTITEVPVEKPEPTPDESSDTNSEANPDETTEQEPEVKIETTYKYTYGFYLYKEGSGNSVLDSIIKNNGIKQAASFYPVIPLRNWTAWHTGDKAKHINDALVRLQLYDYKKGRDNAYKDLREGCEKGMQEGNIGDIDHITLLLGVAINSRNQADLKYIFEFFFNCYQNYALSLGIKPQGFLGGRALYLHQGWLGGFFGKIIRALLGNQEDNFYTKFQLYNPNSNFNYTYGWINADYFEANGTFKPNAKVGEYGVLAGKYSYQYTEKVPLYDDEGDVLYECNENWEWVPAYQDVTRTTEYNLTLFCYQASKNRYKILMFADLKLVNLVYDGKSITTCAYDAVKNSDSTSEVMHDFSEDSDSTSATWKVLSFTYVENTGDSDSAFIVPLEENTLYECGAKTALDISYGCYYLVFNCWQVVKKKWYQKFWFAAFICNIALVIVAPLPTLVTVFATVNAIALTVIAMQLTTKILSFVFGERLAVQIVKVIIQVVKAVISIIATIACKVGGYGWIVYGICIAAMFVVSAAEVLWQGGTWGEAIKAGAISATTTAVTAYAGAAIGSAASSAGSATATTGASTAASEGASASTSFLGQSVTVAGTQMTAGSFIATSAAQGFISSSVSGLLNGQSLGKSLKSGLVSGAISGATAALTVGASNLGLTDALKGDTIDYSKITASDLVDIGTKAFAGQLVNVNTFGNLLKMGIAERQYHKMANMENDYQEFNNKAAAAIKVLNQLAELVSGTTTMESVARMQACLGRSLTAFPDTNQTMSPEAFLSVAVLSGSDACKIVLGNIDIWCDAQLTMDGYSPSDLHYSTFSNTLAWDSGLNTAV